jgi:hypothetical protein
MKRLMSLGLIAACAAMTTVATAQPVPEDRYIVVPGTGQPGNTVSPPHNNGYYPQRGDVYAYGEAGPDRDWYREHRSQDCRAARWDPNHRYMPGEMVRREGRVYMATDVSRRVYNVNSPPEWTPNYWAPVRCR